MTTITIVYSLNVVDTELECQPISNIRSLLGLPLTMQRLFQLVTILLALSWFDRVDANSLTKDETPDPYQDAMRALSEGRIGDARIALSILVRNEPDSPGAWLDLATLRCSLGDAAEARRLFDDIEARFSPPPAIIEIIHQQRTTGCQGNKTPSQFSFSFGRGYDSNANQGASNPNFSIGSGSNKVDLVLLPAYRPTSDQYYTASVDYLSDIPVFENSLGFVQFQARQYDKLSYLDTSSLSAGVERTWYFGEWGLRGRVAGSATALGGSSYLNQGQVQLEVQPPLNLPAGWQMLFVGGWSSMNYPLLPSYNGNVFEARSVLRHHTENFAWQASAGAMFDQQINRRLGGNRKGGFISLEGRFRFVKDSIAEIGWQHQYWQAEDIYSPGLIDVARKQNTDVLRANVSFPVLENHSIIAEYQYTYNRENISIFQHREQLIQINWQFRL